MSRRAFLALCGSVLIVDCIRLQERAYDSDDDIDWSDPHKAERLLREARAAQSSLKAV